MIDLFWFEWSGKPAWPVGFSLCMTAALQVKQRPKSTSHLWQSSDLYTGGFIGKFSRARLPLGDGWTLLSPSVVGITPEGGFPRLQEQPCGSSSYCTFKD